MIPKDEAEKAKIFKSGLPILLNMSGPEKAKKVELLAPAKNFMALKASAPYADAVYFGVESFNMRMKADNFSVDSLSEIAEQCHNPEQAGFRKRKAFLTLNILVYENELQELEAMVQAAKKARIDAVIVHDFAAIDLAKKYSIPFHISTQCNVSNSVAAMHYESLGAERIILARECSLGQIAEITPKMHTAEIETFVHGAMCSSISGRCYLSQTIACSNLQSANRGVCTQPCRGEWQLISQDGTEFLYDGERIFNSRDLCMIDHVPEMIDTGIKSLKIEGRMRHPHYVETVTRVYREAIDAYYQGNFKQQQKERRWITQLKQVYNRGFTTGFFYGRASVEDSQLRSPANVSHFRYIEMGRILESFPTGAAKIQIDNGTLSVGDAIIVMSTQQIPGCLRTYFTQKIKDLRVDGKEVQNIPRGDKAHPVILTTKLAEPVNSGSIDAIFKFTEETYRPLKQRSIGQKQSYQLR